MVGATMWNRLLSDFVRNPCWFPDFTAGINCDPIDVWRLESILNWLRQEAQSNPSTEDFLGGLVREFVGEVHYAEKGGVCSVWNKFGVLGGNERLA